MTEIPGLDDFRSVERLSWFAQCWADAGDLSRNKVACARNAEAKELGGKTFEVIALVSAQLEPIDPKVDRPGEFFTNVCLLLQGC
jgi:hypothetical protein